MPEQDADALTAVVMVVGEILVSIPVKIGHDHLPRPVARARASAGRERPSTLTAKDGQVIAPPVGDDQVDGAVAIEVGRYDRDGAVAGGVSDRR